MHAKYKGALLDIEGFRMSSTGRRQESLSIEHFGHLEQEEHSRSSRDSSGSKQIPLENTCTHNRKVGVAAEPRLPKREPSALARELRSIKERSSISEDAGERYRASDCGAGQCVVYCNNS